MGVLLQYWTLAAHLQVAVYYAAAIKSSLGILRNGLDGDISRNCDGSPVFKVRSFSKRELCDCSTKIVCLEIGRQRPIAGGPAHSKEIIFCSSIADGEWLTG